MFVLHRIALPSLNAFVITAALLYMMFLLIKSDDPGLLPRPEPLKIPWQTMPEETEVKWKTVKPIEPLDVDLPPDIPKLQEKFVYEPSDQVAWAEPIVQSQKGVIAPPQDKPLVLAIGYQARYPERALRAGTEGYVVIGFSVTASGEVFDPFVIESQPKGVFEKSALKAITKFRYNPKTVAGKAVNASGQRYLFTYKLEV